MVWHTVSMQTVSSEILPGTLPGPLLHSLHLDHDRVEAGVSLATVNDFLAASGMDWKNVYEIVIPARTLKHRRSRREALSRDESDKLARLVRVFDQAVSVFGDTDRARGWLAGPKHRFANRTPFELLRTEVGGRMVEDMLGQIDEGMFA